MKSMKAKWFTTLLTLMALAGSTYLSSTTVTAGPEDCRYGDAVVNTCPTNSFFDSTRGSGGGLIRFGLVAMRATL
jgi:hypothetical protein